jgi:LacI family transcriptional regulator
MARAENLEEYRRNRVTIREVAEQAGVSIATVSRVVNGHSDVSEETRDTVMRIVREHGYATNRSARGLSAGRTGLVGVLVPLVYPVYFSAILSGAAEALYEQELRLVLSPTQHEHDREVSLLERLMRGTTDGAILMLPEESADELRMLQRQGFPFVVVDPREAPPEGIACVAAMHASGAKQATEHLLELGHRRIGAIAGAPGWYATEERLNGFRAALAGAGILPDPELIVYSDWRIPQGTQAAEQLLSLAEPPTAIFGFNDNVAIGVLHAAHRRGLSVPRDLSVVGFDDTEPARIVTPQLTSVRQPLAEMGRMGVSLLVRLIEGQRVDALRLELATKLVVRDSTAPPR